MIPYRIFYCKGSLWLAFLAILLSACNRGTPSPVASPVENTVPSQSIPSQSVPSPSALIQTVGPTQTSLPLAARINGIGITQAEYQAEMARFQQAVGHELSELERQRVMDDLINQSLLAQTAVENGFSLDEDELQLRLENLAGQIGGTQALADWMAANGYTESEFRQQLARAAAAAWMRDQITDQVPATAEQVHVRQILLRTAEEADQVYAQLQAGAQFDVLARTADPITAGELGWFPRGILFFPELEEAVFKLTPGQYTPVIQTSSGYHILYLIEKDPQHPLVSQARLTVQERALQQWLEDRRKQSQIELISP